MPGPMASLLQNNLVNFGGRWLKLFWNECKVSGMDAAIKKNTARLARKKLKRSKTSDGGGESVGGDGGSGGGGIVVEAHDHIVQYADIHSILLAKACAWTFGSSPRPILRIAIQNYGRVLVNYLEICISFLICPLI